MMAGPDGLFVSHEHRIQRLEDERLGVETSIASLRTELRTEVKNIKEQLNRIEDKLDERPSRSEMVEGRRSRGPKLEIDGKKLMMKVSGALPIVISLIVLGIVVALWFRR